MLSIIFCAVRRFLPVVVRRQEIAASVVELEERIASLSSN